VVEQPALQRLNRACGCNGSIPVRLSRAVLEAAWRANLPPSTVVMSYHCRRCGIVSFRLEDFPVPIKRAA
jgi:hypothetical protein